MMSQPRISFTSFSRLESAPAKLQLILARFCLKYLCFQMEAVVWQPFLSLGGPSRCGNTGPELSHGAVVSCGCLGLYFSNVVTRTVT